MCVNTSAFVHLKESRSPKSEYVELPTAKPDKSVPASRSPEFNLENYADDGKRGYVHWWHASSWGR